MSGRFMTWLMAATLCNLVPVAVQAQSEAPPLPDGVGEELVEATCTACHQTDQITRSSGYTHEDWQELTSSMVDLSGNPEMRAEIIDYLAGAFPAEQRAGA